MSIIDPFFYSHWKSGVGAYALNLEEDSLTIQIRSSERKKLIISNY